MAAQFLQLSKVPQASNLLTVSSKVRDAVAGCVGKAVGAFVLAQVAVLQRDSNERDEEIKFDNNDLEDQPDEKQWQSFDNLISEDPVKSVTNLATVATPVKMGLTALLISIADLIGATGKLPVEEPVAHLAAAQYREAGIVRFMAAVNRQMRDCLRADPLCRDIGYDIVFRQKLEALVPNKGLVDRSSETIRLFLDFLKVVAWYTASAAYEHGHATLNPETFYSILAYTQATLSGEEAPLARDVLGFVKDAVGRCEADLAAQKIRATKAKAVQAAKAAATKKAAAKNNGGAAPAAAPAANGAGAAAAAAAAPVADTGA